jgi:hypothetical protein
MTPPPMMTLPDYYSLGAARDWLRQRVEHGAECPCCTQHVKVYKRRVNKGMAQSLVDMYRAAGREWQHIPTTVGGRSREEGKLRYWGLIEESDEPRDDGGHAGWWRVTPDGEEFLQGRVSIPMYARVFDGRCLGFIGDPVSISDALGAPFDLRELMAA